MEIKHAPPPPNPLTAALPSIDVEKIIGRLVIEMEMLRASALAERRRFMAEIEELKSLTATSTEATIGK